MRYIQFDHISTIRNKEVVHMLVLTRNQNESIIITTPDGVEITIRLLEGKKGQAQLGIIAPREYSIARDELLNKEVFSF